MSSVRGGIPRGRGRGSSQPISTRGRGLSNRYNKNVSRGDASNRAAFGQPSPASGGQASGSEDAANLRSSSTALSQRGAFGTAKTRGTWQDRYQTLMKARERERADAIRQGQIADPDKPRSLAEAVTPVGTCQDMCAEYERVQRVVQKDVWDEELSTNHSAFATTEREPDEARMVKKFRRAAAGLEEQLPSDLRPPQVLKQTCDYLFDVVIAGAPSLAHVHHFVWDRTRAIRNDFSIQQVTKPDELRVAIECYERIARFHILSLHQLALPENPYSKYDYQQEREQLDRTLLSLMQYYDDSHGRITLPNEAEFRAYCVIFQLQDPTPDLEDRVQTWSKEIVRDQRVRTAVNLYMAACNIMDGQGPLKPRANHLIAQQDWQRFWTLVSSREVSYLMACVAEIYFNLVRRTVLNALFRTFRTNSTMATPDWTIDILCDLLAFDDEDQVYAFCESFGFSFKERDDGHPYLDLTSRRGKTLPEPTAGSQKQLKSALVEHKRLGRTLPSVINGFSVKQAQEAGLVHEENDESMEDAVHVGNPAPGLVDGEAVEDQGAAEDEDSLFIPETTSTSFSQPQTSLFSNNGQDVKPQSVFSNPFSGTSTFGKPSNFGEQSNIFAKSLDQQKDAKTSSSPFSKPSNFGDQPSLFAKPLDQQTNGNTSTSPFGNGTFKAGFPTPTPSSMDTNTPPSLFKFPSNDASISPKSTEPPKFSFGQPPLNLTGISSKNNTPPESTPLFSFATPKKPESKEPRTNDRDIGQLAKSPSLDTQSKALSPEQPKAHVVLGEATAGSESPSATAPNSQSETKPATQHQSASPTSPSATSNNHAVSSSGLNFGVKRSSFSTDTKPKKPSPLSNSITASDDNSAVASESSEKAPESRSQVSPKSRVTAASVEKTPQAGAAQSFDALVSRLADELFYDPDVGLLKQYLEYAVGRMVKEVHDDITTEQNNKEADDWRRFTLHQKYGKRWREIFWQRRHAKIGRERRQRRQRRLQERGSQQPDNHSLYDDSSLRGSSRDGSRLDERVADVTERSEMGGLMSILTFNRQSASQRNISAQQASLSTARPTSSQSRSNTPATAFRASGHKRLKSTSHIDEKGRVTKPSPTSHPNADLLQRSSFLDYSAAKDGLNSNKDASMSSYFRLKALGLGKVESMIGPRGTKRRSESLQSSPATSPPALRFSGQTSWSPDRPAARSQAIVPSSVAPGRSPTNDEDEALFARLRAARENLKETASYLHSEIPRDDTLMTSVGSHSSTDSPSLIRARTEARPRASHGESKGSVPAYRLRESRFVPREHYGRAIERSREIRASRSRETSRPESRIDQHSPDTTMMNQRLAPHENHSDSPSFDRINGISKASDDSQKALPSNPNRFALDYQTPVSFSNHTTQLSANNPFLDAAPSNAFDSFAPNPIFGLESTQTSDNKSQDHTVRPSQIEASLANSFGASFGHVKNSFEPIAGHNPIPPQQDSYINSEVISLMSDDEDEPSIPIRNQDYCVPDKSRATEQPLDRGSAEEYQDSFAQAKACLSQDHNEETESGGWNSQAEVESEDGQAYLRHGQQDVEYDSQGDVNGYSGEEDGRSTDVDADENENEMDSVDGDRDGYDAEEEVEDYDEVEDEEEGDEEGYEYPSPQKWNASQNYANSWSAAPSSRNSALRDVGNSAEEAIELSD